MKQKLVFMLLCVLPAIASAQANEVADVEDGQHLHVTMHKSPYCGCCSLWAEHLREQGFSVSEVPQDDMIAVKEKYGIPQQLQSCHTAEIDGYIIEGHVPAADILRLLREKPEDARGLSVPGMPLGSPGMEHPRPQSYQTFLIQKDGSVRVFAEHPAGENPSEISHDSHDQ